MAVADMIPEMNDAELANLDDNVRRFEVEAQGAKQAQAAHLRPLIDAELARREALKPPKKPPVRKPAVKKAGAKKPAAKKTAA